MMPEHCSCYSERSFVPGVNGGKVLFNGCREPVWDDEKGLEMDSGDDCTTV